MRFVRLCNPAEGYGFSQALGLLPPWALQLQSYLSAFLSSLVSTSASYLLALVSHSGITSSDQVKINAFCCCWGDFEDGI